MTNLTSAFRDDVNASKNQSVNAVLISDYSQIQTKHINTPCGQNVELYIKTQSVPRSKHTPSRL